MQTKYLFWLVFLFCALLNLNAQNLRQKALEVGLKPMPKTQEEVEKLVIDKNPYYKLYPPTPARINLGKKLFFEPRLSKSGLISCNTCHNLGLGGTDGVSVATGHKWQANPKHINSPSVYNAVLNEVLFWNGSVKNLHEQAKKSMTNPVEMASTPDEIVKKVKSIQGYVDDFEKAYGKNAIIDFDLIAATISIFERTLFTPSRFDDFLNGDENALSDAEKQGLSVFIKKGCVSCHTGINLGGKMSLFEIASKYKYFDLGDFRGDNNHMIKIPTLRNIALTTPYFHNGAIWDLKEAILFMGQIQLGIKINSDEIEQIATFLNSLSGKMPEITYPILPPSSINTPRPILEHNFIKKENE